LAKFLLDEDVHKSLAHALRDLGHEVARAQEVGLSGSPDEQVFEFAQLSASILVTGDLGIADARVLGADTHAGVILLRMPNELSTDLVNTEFARLLEQLPIDDFRETIAIMEPGNVRIRRQR